MKAKEKNHGEGLSIVAICLVLITVISCVSVIGFLSLRNVDADNPPGVSSLFMLDGSIDRQIAADILYAVDNNDRATVFRLFPDVGSGYTLGLSQLNWRFVHEGDGRIAMWAVHAYRNSMFNANVNHPGFVNLATTPHLGANNYYRSELRNALTSDFGAILGAIPGIADGMLQKGPTQFDSDAGIENDFIWLPSIQELQVPADWGQGGTGTWGLSSYGDRTMLGTGGFGEIPWTRSWDSRGVNGSQRIMPNGSLAGYSSVANILSIRPALYLDVEVLELLIGVEPIDIQESKLVLQVLLQEHYNRFSDSDFIETTLEEIFGDNDLNERRLARLLNIRISQLKTILNI